MKKKFGFTLAEVLITLGIVGVVAALTAPALVKNSGQAKIGPALSKFVNTFETGCEQMMQNEGANKLSSVGSFDYDDSGRIPLFENLSKYVVMIPIDKNSDEYKNYVMYWKEGARFDVNNSIYQLKDGSLLINAYTGHLANSNYDAQGAFLGRIGCIIYDIDGFKGKNMVGKDLFGFVVDNSGILIPYGGNMLKSLVENPSNMGDCANIEDGRLGMANGLACTGKIADNGWKADY